jgi:hypothetical protein
MAKKRNGPTKSHSIREHLTANPTASAKEVVASLAEMGINTNEGLVYAVKGGMKERKKRKARVVKAAKAASAESNGAARKVDVLSMIKEVKGLAKRAGGFEKLKELVDALAE